MFKNPKDAEIFSILRKAKKIAVVGMSNKEERSSFLVARELQKAGYQIFPVNPMLEGQTVLGERVYASLLEIPEPVDIVDVFRKQELLPSVAREFLQIQAPVFWAQSGLISEEAAEILRDGGAKAIIMDRCIKIELLKMGWAQG